MSNSLKISPLSNKRKLSQHECMWTLVRLGSEVRGDVSGGWGAGPHLLLILRNDSLHWRSLYSSISRRWPRLLTVWATCLRHCTFPLLSSVRVKPGRQEHCPVLWPLTFTLRLLFPLQVTVQTPALQLTLVPPVQAEADAQCGQEAVRGGHTHSLHRCCRAGLVGPLCLSDRNPDRKWRGVIERAVKEFKIVQIDFCITSRYSPELGKK